MAGQAPERILPLVQAELHRSRTFLSPALGEDEWNSHLYLPAIHSIAFSPASGKSGC